MWRVSRVSCRRSGLRRGRGRRGSGCLSFVPDGEAAVAEEPGGRPLGLPAVRAEALAGLDAGRAIRATRFRLRSQRRLRGAEQYALSARTFTGFLRRGPRREQTAGMPGISGLNAWLSGTFAPPDTATAGGMPWASDSTCGLLSFLPLSTGFGPVSEPPFARADAASTIADDQSSSPLAPSSSSTARCGRHHSPVSVHTVNRRCAVAGETPNESGGYRHAHPLVSTYTMAVNTTRSSTGAVPPPCGRDVNFGDNGAVSSHSSSGTSRRDRSAPTVQHHAASANYHVRHPLGQGLRGRTGRLPEGTAARVFARHM